jgi:hypothetical protein
MKGVWVLYVRPIVENLWMPRAKAVENRTPEFISVRDANDPRRWALRILPSRVASLDRFGAPRKIVGARIPSGIK